MQLSLTPLLLACALTAAASANDYDEAIDGDISDNRFNPTCFDLEIGINRLTATQQGSGSGGAIDRDYLTIIIPPGMALQEFRLISYSHPTDLAFVGFQEGTRFVGTPFMTMASDLLGGHVYGLPDVGQDLFPAMNALPDVQGFPVPLPSGSYSFWFNQASLTTTASFEFDVVRDTIGATFCSVPPNSTGVESVLFASGSPALAENDLTLGAANLPANQTAMVLASRAPDFVANPGGSLGNLCLGGSIGRFPGAMAVDALGFLGMEVDLLDLPQPAGAVSASQGETWYFQVWHREPGGSSHFTPGVSVLVD